MYDSERRNGRVDARVTPLGSLEVLSQLEVNRLRDTSEGGLHDLFRRCSLAVLNSGQDIDDEFVTARRRVVDRRNRFTGHRSSARVGGRCAARRSAADRRQRPGPGGADPPSDADL